MSGPQTRDGNEDPAVALGETLKELRQDAGITTQAAAGARLGYSNDSVSKAETGRHVPTMDMLLAMLDLYQAPQAVRKVTLRLHALARKAHGPIPEFIQRYFQAELKAAFLRIWAHVQVPGLLQVEEYARAMYELPGIDKGEVAEMVAVRMDRQSNIEGPDAAQVIVVLDEVVLYRLIGSPEVMVKQLDHLRERSQRPNVTIQVAKGKAAYWGLAGGFEISSGPDIPDTLLMLAMEDQTFEDPALTRRALIQFEKVRGYALNIEDSQAAIMEARRHWESQQ